MTDRELLELAAKAAGASDCAGVQSEWEGFICLRVLWGEDGDYEDWNPLTNDGDALRLAVKLGIDICINIEELEVWADGCREPVISDAEEATRHAIVRAAAAIGKDMP